ncbi:glycoside hydrolase family 47 protein [Earliella scabrosa]|nr:glycoside hydrolase family 47 protein [Earliella scabrosa]
MVSWSLRTSVVALACMSSALSARIQTPFLVLPRDAPKHKQAVKDIFMDSWNAYKEFAFPHDDLAPISKGFVDSRNGWGASIADAISTMIVMDEQELVKEAVDHMSTVDFTVSHTSDTVSIFETTIRFLGGLLSAYELTGEKFPALLEQAETLAQKMTIGWSRGNVVPFGHVNFNNSRPNIGTSNIAEAGTLTLEWSRLAKYTGNDTYRALAEDSVRQIASQPAPIPGFPAQGIDPSTGKAVGAYVTWGGGSDSYIEYLIKYARLTNTDDDFFTDTWVTAVDSSIKTLLKKSTVGDWTYLADLDNSGTIRHIGSHLACFMAGNWIMGGKMTNNKTIVNIGLDLNEGCWNTYASTATGIGPEAFGFISKDGNYSGETPSSGDLAFYNKHGFYILDGASYYYMRPEVLESNFYAYRATGDRKYFERAVGMIDSINSFLRTPTVAFAPIEDVDATDSDFIDDMESFWFAEVLKYLYLTFDDPNRWSLDKYVFNTEAHPFIAPPPKPSYGSGKRHIVPGAFKTTSGELPAVSPALKLPERKPEISQ